MLPACPAQVHPQSPHSNMEREVLIDLWEWVLSGIHDFAVFMSIASENLLKKFLILNPSKRGILEEIMRGPGG